MAKNGFLISPSLHQDIKRTIARVNGIPFGGEIVHIPTDLSGAGFSSQEKVFRVCTASGSWPADTEKVVAFYGVTATPNTVSVMNKLVSLPAAASTNGGRIVNVAKDGTQWYLVSFEMSTATAVFSRSTQSASVVTSVETRTITYVTPGPSVDVLADVSASLNTQNCSITINKTTARVKTAGDTQSAAVVASVSTQEITIAADTYTATFIRLEI